MVLSRLEVRRQLIHQLASEITFALGHLRLALRDPRQLPDRDDFVREVHRRDSEHLLHRADRDQVLLGAHHEPRERDLLRFPHHLEQQLIGLLRALVGGRQIVRVVVVDRVDFPKLHELLDLHRRGLLETERGELLRLHHDETPRLDLKAFDDVRVGDLLAVGGRHALGLDARVILAVELVEAHRLALHRGEELHGHIHEPEADAARPERGSHGTSLTAKRGPSTRAAQIASARSRYASDTSG